jgi:hypothetical protein
VAQTLAAARAETAERLSRHVAEISVDSRDTSPSSSRLLDRRERGWPAVGRVSGLVTDSVVPGSDEHLEGLAD